MPTRRNAALGPLLLEVSLIVLGVLLALGLNAWWAARAERARATEALIAIAEEVQTNREETTRSTAYHEALLDTLQTLSSPPGHALFQHGYTRPANLMSAAWELALATDALSHLPPDQARAAARVYAEQQRYETTARAATEPLFALLFNQGASGVLGNYRNLMMIISALSYREQALIAVYDDALMVFAP